VFQRSKSDDGIHTPTTFLPLSPFSSFVPHAVIPHSITIDVIAAIIFFISIIPP
jgi:hypothetical protein